jgi:NAD(P)-dependent dehydrogenase (short-subunit alcohol dehydrogenase family)
VSPLGSPRVGRSGDDVASDVEGWWPVAGWTDEDLPDLAGRVAVVTGGTDGVGFEVVRALAAHGAHVVLAGRDAGRNEAAAERVRAATGADDRVEPGVLELGEVGSVRAFAEGVTGRHERVDFLVNNGGVQILPRREVTADGAEAHFGVNHLGHFALTGLLLPALRAGGRRATVVTVTSMMYRTATPEPEDPGDEDYRPGSAYARSKLANVLFARELARRYGGSPRSLLAHPGWARTRPSGQALTDLGTRLFAQPARAGAWPVLYAATRGDLPNGALVGPGHFFGMRGSPARATFAPVADDASAASRLWTDSERRTGVRYPAPDPG